MNAAWQRLSIRERRLILAMGAVVLGVAAFSLIAQPVRQRLSVVERQYQQQVTLADQLQQAQPQHAVARGSDQPLSLLISDSATAAGLELQQMDTDSDLLRLTVSGDFTQLLQWLDHAERNGAALQSLTLEKRDALLEARVVFK